VADNGAGKSTLLAILKGIMDYSEGTVSRQKGITVRFLDQDPQRPGEMSVRVFLYQYDDQVGILVDQYQTLAQNPDADHDVLHTLL
jgi:ATPase subunit of ABC transporter with duplicated ATPase domains